MCRDQVRCNPRSQLNICFIIVFPDHLDLRITFNDVEQSLEASLHVGHAENAHVCDLAFTADEAHHLFALHSPDLVPVSAEEGVMIATRDVRVIYNGRYTRGNRFIDHLCDGGISAVDEQSCWACTDYFLNSIDLGGHVPIRRPENGNFYVPFFS